jgi:hypothetical protein
MILVQLNGGLGNQLFQYALGRKLLHLYGGSLRFDIRLLSLNHTPREYGLDHFRIQGKLLTSSEQKGFYVFQQIPLFRSLFSTYQERLPHYRRLVVLEQSPFYDENILKARPNVALKGYWQSEKYFLDIRPILLEELRLKDELDTQNQKLYREICDGLSVSLHIRRGDYLSNPAAYQFHGVLPLEYYQRGINLLNDINASLHYYVFSDDIPWVQRNLQIKNATFVSHNGAQRDYVDLTLMRACRYHIIANSSFSWWGAWLSDYPDKRVFAPRQWCKQQYDARDLIPSSWELL